MTKEQLTKIRDAVKVLAQLSNEEWEELYGIIKETSRNSKISETKVKANHKMFEDVTRLIQRIGIPANIKGYSYLRSAIIFYMKAEKPGNISLVKELYPAVGEEFNTTWSKVERAIRHAIDVAFVQGNIKAIAEIFKTTSRVTNGEAIATMAEYLKMH